MFEHVGADQLANYFRTCLRLTRPGGRFLNHGITTGRRDIVRDLSHDPDSFIANCVSPDGALAPARLAVTHLERAGFELVDVERLRPHYARALEHWVARLEANAEPARRLAGEEVYRIWRAYMAEAALGFESGDLGVVQILARRHGLPAARAAAAGARAARPHIRQSRPAAGAAARLPAAALRRGAAGAARRRPLVPRRDGPQDHRGRAGSPVAGRVRRLRGRALRRCVAVPGAPRDAARRPTVAVKIQRPGVEQQIEQDLALLGFLARRLERRRPETLAFRPREAVAELGDQTRRQLDFVREARTAERVRALFPPGWRSRRQRSRWRRN